MNKDHIAHLTNNYLDAIAVANDFVYVDSEVQIPLTQVYVMLEAVQSQAPKPLEKRDEMIALAPRLESAEIKENEPQPKEQTDAGAKDKMVEKKEKEYISTPFPIPLTKALKENQHLVLLGEPGAGKTTTLQFIGLCFAKQAENWVEERLKLDEKRVPVRLVLQDFADRVSNQGSSILEGLTQEVSSRLSCKREAALELIEDWSSGGQLLILLDGLDETSDQHHNVITQIRNFANATTRKDVRVVVSSRLAGFTTLGNPFKEYVIKPLEEPEEAEVFVHGWLDALLPGLGEQSRKLIEALRAQPALRRLTNNPLILRLAAEQYARSRKIAQNRAELYAAYVNEAWVRGVSRGVSDDSKDIAFQALEVIAWHLQMDGKADEAEIKQALIKYKIVGAESRAIFCLKIIREQMGLVIYMQGRFVFSHATFREYFVAQRLKRIWEKNIKSAWSFLRPRLHLPSWREPLLLFASSLDESQAKKLISKVRLAKSRYEYSLHRDLVLAAMLLEETKISDSAFIQPRLSELRNLSLSRPSEIKSFRKIGPLIASMLLEEMDSIKLKDERKNISRRRIHKIRRFLFTLRERLHEVADENYSKLLRPYYHDKYNEDDDMFLQTIEVLGEFGDSRVIYNVVQSLSNQNYSKDVVSKNIDILSKADNPEIVSGLTLSLSDDNIHTRKLAVEILGNLRDQRAVPALIELVGDSYFSSRAVKALGRYKDRRAVPVLLSVLKNICARTHNEATTAPNLIGDPQAPYALSEAKEVAEALAEIGGPEAISFLSQLLKSENVKFRILAAEALSSVHDSQALTGLIKALKDQNGDVRRLAAIGLQNVGNLQALPALLEALLNDDSDSSENAAIALGEFGDPQVVPALIQSLDSIHINTRRGAIIGLGKIADPSEVIVQGLIKQIDHKDSQVAKLAIVSLARIGTAGAVTALIEVSRNNENNKSWLAKRLLGRIGESRLISEESAHNVLLYEIDNDDLRAIDESLGRVRDKEILSLIIRYLKDNDIEIQELAVAALEKIGATEAIPALVQEVKQQDDEVWMAIFEEALDRIDDPKVIPVLIQALTENNRAESDRILLSLGVKGDSETAQISLGEIKIQYFLHIMGSIFNLALIPIMLLLILGILSVLVKLLIPFIVSLYDYMVNIPEFPKILDSVLRTLGKMLLAGFVFVMVLFSPFRFFLKFAFRLARSFINVLKTLVQILLFLIALPFILIFGLFYSISPRAGEIFVYIFVFPFRPLIFLYNMVFRRASERSPKPAKRVKSDSVGGTSSLSNAIGSTAPNLSTEKVSMDHQFLVRVIKRLLRPRPSSPVGVPKYQEGNDKNSELLSLLEKLETLTVPNYDPMFPPEPPKLYRVLRWLGSGCIAGFVFGLVGILSKVVDNTQSYVLVGIIGILIGFLGWIVEEIRDMMKNEA